MIQKKPSGRKRLFSLPVLCAIVLIRFAAAYVINTTVHSFALNHYFFFNFKQGKKDLLFLLTYLPFPDLSSPLC